MREDERRPEFETLRGLSDDLGAAGDVDEVGAAAAVWVHATIDPDAVVGLSRPDASGRLRSVWRDNGHPVNGRRRSTLRRRAFDSMRSVRVRTSDDGGRIMAMLPLSCRGEPLGVLEVLASEHGIDAMWELLEVGTSQIGVALHAVQQRAHLQHVVDALEQASNLGAALVRARTPDAAVRIAVRLVWERFRAPVAGWCGEDMQLVAVKGLTGGKLRELRRAMPTLPRWRWLPSGERDAVRRRFGELAGVGRVSALDGGDGVILSGWTTDTVEPSIQGLGSLVAEVLRLLDNARLADQRTKQLDMGIAWTAHELRGPLLGIRTVLELLLKRDNIDPSELPVLRASVRELDRLSGTAEAILAWAVGVRPLQRKETDLVRIVEEVVESCQLESSDNEVVILGPERAVALFDPPHLRTVVANLLRNALAYSAPGTKVEVSIENEGDHLLLSVKDEGPPIPIEERHAIFDPFVRGGVGGSVRDGSGLGLFIARRVVEAHRGRIWVESECGHTTFRVLLPVGGRSRRRFAS